MSPSRLFSVFAVAACLSSGTAFAEEEPSGCSAVALYSDDGAYESCQVANGDRIEFLDRESSTEESCALACSALAEISAMAEESRELDVEAGF